MKTGILLGALLILAGILLGFGNTGFIIEYSPPFSKVSAEELNVWRAHTLFVLPGSALLFYSLPAIRASWTLPKMGLNTKLSSLFVTLALSFIYRIGRLVFLRDLPVTDEEYTGQLGGRLLAAGKLQHDFNLPHEQMPTLFLFERQDTWSSFDFLGIQLAWMFSELTYTGPWIFCLCSAATVVVFFHVMLDMTGRRDWAMFGAMLLASSPMFTLLSFTTHAHILSRLFFTCAVLGILRTVKTREPIWAAAAGLSFGAGVLSRPAETLLLTVPFLAWYCRTVWKRESPPSTLFAFILGGLPCAVVLGLHNHAITDSWWLLPRIAPNTFPNPDGGMDSLNFLQAPVLLLRRIADNLVNNVSFTFIYWHGLFGTILFLIGMLDKEARCFIFGLLLHCTSTLFHDNDGVRVVGPIHFSEWTIPLSAVATLGMTRIAGQMPGRTLKSKFLQAAAGMLVVGSTFFVVVQGISLRQSNSWHHFFFEFVEGSVPKNSVVLAPRNAYFWSVFPPQGYNRSWVFETRAPKVDLSDEILILRYTTDSESKILRRFPDRRVFIAKPTQSEPFISISEVVRDDSTAPPIDKEKAHEM